MPSAVEGSKIFRQAQDDSVEVRGTSTQPRREFGSLAQLVEQLAFNQLVGRSSRPRPTIISLPRSCMVASSSTPVMPSVAEGSKIYRQAHDDSDVVKGAPLPSPVENLGR